MVETTAILFLLMIRNLSTHWTARTAVLGAKPCKRVISHNDFQRIDRIILDTYFSYPWKTFTQIKL